MRAHRFIRQVVLLLLGAMLSGSARAQFIDTFDGPAVERWTFFTGDGEATMDFRQGEGFASILVDATADRRNIWWALIKRDVSASLDLGRLRRPGQELRVEARIRTSHAPRRVNLHLNTQKTRDFHTHLMEFDLPDTLGWHTISMTTRGFKAAPGDMVNAQLALMDWGLGRYRVDVDYYRVDVVDAATAGPDVGEPLPYHPPAPPLDAFRHVAGVAEDAVVDLRYPAVNFGDWYAADEDGPVRVLTVSGTQYVILRWNLRAYAGKTVEGLGVLTLTTRSVQRMPTSIPEFGLVRVVEILGGDPAWRRETVTLDGLTHGQPLDVVFNPQMIIDVAVAEVRGEQMHVSISRPVLQRMVDGRTLGLALQPLGAINATFYAHDADQRSEGPTLYFNLRAP